MHMIVSDMKVDSVGFKLLNESEGLARYGSIFIFNLIYA